MILLPWLWAYGAALLVIGVLDAAWLGLIARDFYRREMREVAAENFRKGPALAFYLLYPIALLVLSLSPLPADWGAASWRAALVGLTAYATYDLTNWATLKQWSWRLALADMAWGTFISAAAGAAAFVAWGHASS